MKLNETSRCDICKINNQLIKKEEDGDCDANNKSELVVVKCLDCNYNLCSACLVQHLGLNHKLVNLIENQEYFCSNTDQQVAETNNNTITQSQLFQNGLQAKFQQQQQQQQQILEFQFQQNLNKLKIQQTLHLQQNERLVQIENEIERSFLFYEQTLKERKEYLVKELNTIIQYAVLNHAQNLNKQMQIQYQLEMKKQQIETELSQCGMDQVNNNNNNTNNYKLINDLNEISKLLSINNQLIVQFKNTNPLTSIEFVSNFSAIQTSIRNTFGFIRINPNQTAGSVLKQAGNEKNAELKVPTELNTDLDWPNLNKDLAIEQSLKRGLEEDDEYDQNLYSGHKDKVIAPDNLSSMAKTPLASKWSSASSSVSSSGSTKSSAASTSSTGNPKRNHHEGHLLRSKMIYQCKFGEFGINNGQFTEPSGVTLGSNDDIVVADTNSHRIQIFDKDGNFKFKFGECGKRDGQLLYPNRVCVDKQTGDIVVTERSPTHQIQVFNKHGQFLRKFGATILQHPRDVCVDYKSRIIVVECKVMRVIIFDMLGNVLNKFNCSKFLEFPNGVCCANPNNDPLNTREEIYISDNRAHCIKVFDYNGNFLRQIGGEGITNYPIGVGLTSNNEILVADNHNNFNLTIFGQDGKLINALESKIKHAQCFDVGLMEDGSIVLASKDYRIYVYKYGSSTSSTAIAQPNKECITASSYDLFSENTYSLFSSSQEPKSLSPGADFNCEDFNNNTDHLSASFSLSNSNSPSHQNIANILSGLI